MYDSDLRIPRVTKLRCPVCKSSHHLVASILAEHSLLGYTSHFSESMGWWTIRKELQTNNTQGLYLACTECQAVGTEDFFNPRKKPPRMYHDRNGFYVKIQLPNDMGQGLFEKIELKCYIRATNMAGIDFIGMLKVAAVKTMGELPEFLTWELPTVVEYAKTRLKDFRAATRSSFRADARSKKKKRRKKS